MNTLLQKIQMGMRVFDRDQNDLGTVDYVKFGDEDPNKPGAETASVNPVQRDPKESLIGNLLDVFSPDDIPEELQARLLREGFVRIESPGLFHADRYVLPEQVQSVSVSEGEVRLNVTKAALVKRV